MPVDVIITITGDMAFNYFFSLFFYLTVIMAPMFGALALLAKN